jgi:hypothetical protein
VYEATHLLSGRLNENVAPLALGLFCAQVLPPFLILLYLFNLLLYLNNQQSYLTYHFPLNTPDAVAERIIQRYFEVADNEEDGRPTKITKLNKLTDYDPIPKEVNFNLQ